jgi:PAS domain S-box-containing protein
MVEEISNLDPAKKNMASDEFYHDKIYEAIPDLMFIIRTDGMLCNYKPVISRVLKLPPEEFLGKNIAEIVPGWLANLVIQNVNKAINTGDIQNFNYHMTLAEDSHYFEVRCIALEHDRALVLARDITISQRFEESLKLTQFAMDKMADMTFWAAMDGRIIYVNESACTTLGYTKDEFMKMKILDIDADFDEKKLILHLEEVKERGCLKNEARQVKKDGTIIPVDLTINYLKNDDKEYICTFAKDITNRKLAELALKDSEEKFRALVEQNISGIFVIDSKENIVVYNKGLEKILKIPREKAISTPLKDILLSLVVSGDDGKSKVDLIRSTVLEMLGPSSSLELIDFPETDIKLPDGEKATVHVRIFPLITSKEVMVAGVMSDITERKRIERELEKEHMELKRSNQDLQQFAYVASHDLKEPLRMVTSYVKLLEKQYKDKLDADANEYIGYVVEGTTRMRQMIDDLLRYSRVDVKGTPMKPIDLELVLKQALLNLSVCIGESHAVITQTPLPIVLGDYIQLTEVFQNLISNAIKFKQKDTPCVHIAAERIDSYWRLSVTDNGIGIDPQYFDKLFIIFERLHSRTEYAGNGIGLAVCKKIVERHGGKIWVESTPEIGSTFFFTIPDSPIEP